MERSRTGGRRDHGGNDGALQGTPASAAELATRWALTTWLSSAPGVQIPAVRAELAASMFRRITSLVQSAIITVLLTLIATIHHPTPAFKTWLFLDGVLVTVRLSLVTAIWYTIHGRFSAATRFPVADLFILAGLIWCLVLGFGAGLCISSGDPGLGTLGAFLAMGTVGGLAARNPGTPRITITQMFLIIVPLACAAKMSTAPVVGWIVVLAPLYLIGMVSINKQLHNDFVELIRSRIENRHYALHCPLTELPNRTLFKDRLAQAVHAAQTLGNDAFLLCLDLDGFKRVNDAHGHPVGDLLLVQVAARISAVIGANDIAARLGGDEFAVLVCDGDKNTAETVAAAIVSALDKTFYLENIVVRIGVSIGVARMDRRTQDPSEVFTQADLALYAAKNSGKGEFRWYEPPAGAGPALCAA